MYCSVSFSLFNSFLQDVKKADIYSVRNSLQTALRRFENNTFESPEEKATLEGLINSLNTVYASL